MTSAPVPVEPVEEPVAEAPRPRPSNEEIAAWALLGTLLLYVLMQHLVSAVVTGLVLFLVLDRLAAAFSKRMPGGAARPLALILVTLITGGVIVGGVAMLISVLRRHAEGVPAIMTKMADILQSTRAWLGGYGIAHTDSVSQTVTVPAGCHTATLTFWLQISSQDTGNTAHDLMTVKVGATVLAAYSNVSRTGYVQKSFNLSAYAGKTVTITFSGTEDATKATSFVVEHQSTQDSHPWEAATSCRHTHTFSGGARGARLAQARRVTCGPTAGTGR